MCKIYMASTFKEKAATKRSGIVYPERVIIANFSHGNIEVKSDDTERTFEMPDGIRMIRGWASVPGVCNFISAQNNADFLRDLNSNKRMLQTMPFDNINARFNEFLGVFKKQDKKQTIEEMRSYVKNRPTILASGDDEAIDTLTEAGRYIHTFDQFFQTTTYNPGDIVIDKCFSRTNSEAVNVPSGREWVMLLVNVADGSLDLLTLAKTQTRNGRTELYLSDIINYLKSQGVTEIIFFDNSCSSFMDEQGNEFNEREIRARRRPLLNASSGVKFGGKKSNKRRNKRRNKKTIKRRR